MSYRVVVTREGKDWLADVPQLGGAHTWARTLHGLDKAIREVIVLAADLPDEAMASLELSCTYRTGDKQIDAEAAELRRRRAEVEKELHSVAVRTEQTAKRLVSAGYSVRDAAALTGVSPQRVSQVTGKKKVGHVRAAKTRSKRSSTRA